MQDLKESQAKEILKASRVGVLSLNDENGSYGIPLYFNYDGDNIFFHCHPGMKDHYIESTKEACLVVIHLESESVWESVQVFGEVSKLSLDSDIRDAKSALFHLPFPPAEGHFPSGNPVRSEYNVFYAKLAPAKFAGKASSYRES